MTIVSNPNSRFKAIGTVIGLLVPLLFMSPVLWAKDPGVMELPDDQAGRCRYGVDHMIGVARQSLSEPGSRPERVEKRSRLVESWESRLDSGDDPCEVYMDIQKAATTF